MNTTLGAVAAQTPAAHSIAALQHHYGAQHLGAAGEWAFALGVLFIIVMVIRGAVRKGRSDA